MIKRIPVTIGYDPNRQIGFLEIDDQFEGFTFDSLLLPEIALKYKDPQTGEDFNEPVLISIALSDRDQLIKAETREARYGPMDWKMKVRIK